MSALTQLEIIRAEAMERLTRNADYRLVSKLDELITDLQVLETSSNTDTKIDLLGEHGSQTDEVETLAEDYVAAELEEKFEALSNDFCDTVREDKTLNGSAAH